VLGSFAMMMRSLGMMLGGGFVMFLVLVRAHETLPLWPTGRPPGALTVYCRADAHLTKR
jgi:hypothetical protein